MKSIDLKNVIWKEGKHYVAWNINTSIASYGKSRKEALGCLREALELYFEDTPRSTVGKVERLGIVPLVLRYA